MERTDELLLEAYREGDESAFPELLQRYKGPLFGYLMRMARNQEIAEDLFQETFLRVHEKAHTFRTGAKFKSWLFTIATHIAIDHLRRSKHRPQLQAMESKVPVPSPGNDPAAETAQLELRETVRDAVDTLPPRQRAALVLSYYQGHTYPEVAAIMGCSLGSVKTHMSRALKTLATRLPEGGVL
ncbi:MAG: RNA polymerase sigma factor [Verrucomicrobia bacterium]|nr:RNA polymerase sigma factor [Verrucomicrobiota bacterium]